MADSNQTPKQSNVRRPPCSLSCSDGRPIQLLWLEVPYPHSERITATHRCIVYHHHGETYSVRGFATEVAAGRWLCATPGHPLYFLSNVTNADQGWCGPLPIKRRAEQSDKNTRSLARGSPSNRHPNNFLQKISPLPSWMTF